MDEGNSSLVAPFHEHRIGQGVEFLLFYDPKAREHLALARWHVEPHLLGAQ